MPRKNHRHQIIQCTVVNQRILERIKRLGVVVLPFGSYIWQHGDDKLDEYGDRISMMFAHRSFIDHEIPIGGASDHPAGLVEPLLALRCMVTRKTRGGKILGSDQKISAEEALRIYTLGSAYATFEEDIKGSIQTGKLADMVVLSEDPTRIDSEYIHEIVVEKTIVGGNVVYQK